MDISKDLNGEIKFIKLVNNFYKFYYFKSIKQYK